MIERKFSIQIKTKECATKRMKYESYVSEKVNKFVNELLRMIM